MIQAIRVRSRDKCSLYRMELVGRLSMVAGLIMAWGNILAFASCPTFKGLSDEILREINRNVCI